LEFIEEDVHATLGLPIGPKKVVKENLIFLVRSIMLSWVVEGENRINHLELLRLKRCMVRPLTGVIMVMNSREISFYMSFYLRQKEPKWGYFF